MDQPLEKSPGCYIPKRYIVTFLGFFGMFNVYAMRVNLSVAMVAMVNNTENAIISNVTQKRVHECAMLENQVKTSEVAFSGEQFNWDAKTQGMVLGAFFYGYVITQIPGGCLSERFGAKWFFGGGVFMTSVLTLLTPVSARMGVPILMAVRVLEGFGEGVTYPAMTFIVSQWSPLMERSRLSTIIFIGCQVGNVVSMPLSGWLSSSDLFGGWPSAFYLCGTIGCIWFVFWAYLVYESPSVHPTISKEELEYIQLDNNNASQKKPFVPWKAIFMSMPMWAALVAQFGNCFGLLVYITELPNYLSSILHFNLTENGALSALPFIAQTLVACVASYVADKLRSSGKMSITWIRKIMNSIGFLGPAVCLLCITVSGCKSELVVCLLTLAMALNGFIFSGYNIILVDMSPEFSGTVYGITNAFGNLSGVIVPAIVGAVTSNGVTISSWNKVFYITSAAYVAGAIFFLIFASAELQPWVKDVKKKEDSEHSMKEVSSQPG